MERKPQIRSRSCEVGLWFSAEFGSLVKRIKGERWSFTLNYCKNISPGLISYYFSSSASFSILSVMESAINVLIAQFKIYAGKDGSEHTLSREEFQSLVTSQLPNFVKNSSESATIDQLMGSLDTNNDGELTFMEFWQLIGNVANQHGGF
ncbi:hypothetical protein DNTS_032063 [Danionella cerebrum]|uniref:EF-hand domain-containing protein n=1 Tax=Danionella cerebrum TaxID=2873325 RepID=A0A553P9N3_9TELE|nr:hypothetical protein DNTS_032063 [Danionella translucida]